MTLLGQYGPDAQIDTAGNALIGAAVSGPTTHAYALDGSGNLTITGPATDALTYTITPVGGLPVSQTVRVAPLESQIETALAAKADLAAAVPASARVGASLGSALKKAKDVAALKVVMTGNSLPYGQDTVSGSTQAAAGGAVQTRSLTTPTDALGTALSFITASATVVNQGFPGDQTATTITRYAAGVSGDVEIIWDDTNDANNYGGILGGPVTVAVSQANLATLIDRAISRGAQPVVVAGAPINNTADTRNVRAYSEAHRTVADRYNVPFFDAAQLLATLDTGSVWTDGVHLSAYAYGTVGARLGAMFGPLGMGMPDAAPGVHVYPLMGAHVGGTVTARTLQASPNDGETIRLTAGQTMVLPVNVKGPCTALIDLYSDSAGNGVGTGVMNYCFNLSGLTARPIDIPTHTSGSRVTVRGHAYRGDGPDWVIVNCLTGTLEIERVRFVTDERVSQAYDGDLNGGLFTRRARVAGMTVGPGRLGFGYDALVDDTVVFSPKDTSPTATAEVDFCVQLPASGIAGPALFGGVNRGLNYLMGVGYLFYRSGSSLIVREFTDSAVYTDTTFTTVFAATGLVTTTITVRLSGTALVVLVDNVVKATITPKWRFFVPGAVADTQMQVFTCGVHTHGLG